MKYKDLIIKIEQESVGDWRIFIQYLNRRPYEAFSFNKYYKAKIKFDCLINNLSHLEYYLEVLSQ